MLLESWTAELACSKGQTFLYLRTVGNYCTNSLIKPILEYCCTVWGNSSKEQCPLPYNSIQELVLWGTITETLLRWKKRGARMILNANFQDNSVMLFTLYYYMRNFCYLIGLEQWYFSLIWNTYMWKLQSLSG